MSDPPKDRNEISSFDATLTGGATSSSAGSIGPYRLLQKLGEGGMGEVWLAEQTEPIHRTVAIKLIKAGMDTSAVVARFESERQALALMDHPNIAKVFDAASTPEGRPYFIMEYVSGMSITKYCDKHRLTVRERLELFIQVCEGVQHAHQKAIIHRDLKPSNVLVQLRDDKAVPKIIDFGLAKATAQRLTEKTMFSELGVMLGTPSYMSPEQADLTERNVDTRTDVYSLGVILYELLVGALPFDPKELREAAFDTMLQKIREQEPPRPSTKIRQLGTDSGICAEKRKEEPQSFARHLQGDLDWITMKALEKDRTRRYGSPSELAADIGRHLRDEPVLAGPPSSVYRVKKFVRRNRTAVLAASSVVLMLFAFAITMTVQAIRIAKERDRANREAAAAKSVSDFLTGLFKVSDPSEARGNTVTARQILDQGVQQIDSGLATQPEVQARLMETMGEVYWSLGLYREAAPLLDKAVATRTRLLGPDHPDTLASLYMTAKSLNDEGQYIEAEKRLRSVLDAQRRVLGPQHPDTVKSMIAISGVIYGQGRYKEAEKMQRDLLDLQRRMPARDEQREAMTMNNLASNLSAQNRFAESEQLFGQTVELERRVFGPDNPITLQSMSNMIRSLLGQAKYGDAEKLARQTLELQSRVLGLEHQDTLWTITNLAVALREDGQRTEAERLLRQTLTVRQKTLGPEHPDTLGSMEELAVTLDELHRYPEAAEFYRKAVDIQRRVLGPDHPVTASTKYNLACNAALSGRLDEAIAVLRDAMDHGLPLGTAAGMSQDNDLKSLRGDPRFAALVAEVKTRESVVKSH